MPSRCKITSTPRPSSPVPTLGVTCLTFEDLPLQDSIFSFAFFTLWWIMCLLSWLWDVSALRWEKRCYSEKSLTLALEPVALNMAPASSQHESQRCVQYCRKTNKTQRAVRRAAREKLYPSRCTPSSIFRMNFLLLHLWNKLFFFFLWKPGSGV